MQVSDANNVKIYNLSAGKSVPDWLSDRKRRRLLNKNVDLRRRIELIQDFEMPVVSTTVKLSPDGNYVMAAGIYKPRVRCYDVNNLSMKFERCLDAEVVTFEILSEDYSKVVFLQCDRYVEFHSAEGRYHRLRIPKFGSDMKYHYPTCDLYLAGASNEIYRLNLERGQFLNPITSCMSEINKIAIGEGHHVILVGGKEGKVEAFDARCRSGVGTLDCALHSVSNHHQQNIGSVPSVTAVTFDGPLNVAVGTSIGQVLLYDIRSTKPYTVKDHMYGLPISDIAFKDDYALSMDSAVVKIWNKNTGKSLTSIGAGNNTKFNNLCLVPDTGLMFIANENVKILSYYIPKLGTAPRWCGFLDAITEELEEKYNDTVYEDYKFITHNELQQLGLSHLIGTNLLRGYMHGYFIDVRLYSKARYLTEPFALEQYRKKKIREKIEADRLNRVDIQKLPHVNKQLAVKLMNEQNDEGTTRKRKNTHNLLTDDRFKQLFSNPDFQIDSNAEEYRLLNPVLKRLDTASMKLVATAEPTMDEVDSSDEDEKWTKQLKEEYRHAKKRRLMKEKTSIVESTGNTNSLQGNTFEERLEKQQAEWSVQELSYGNRSISFIPAREKRNKKEDIQMKRHKMERKQLVRPPPKNLKKPLFWCGPRKNR